MLLRAERVHLQLGMPEAGPMRPHETVPLFTTPPLPARLPGQRAAHTRVAPLPLLRHIDPLHIQLDPDYWHRLQINVIAWLVWRTWQTWQLNPGQLRFRVWTTHGRRDHFFPHLRRVLLAAASHALPDRRYDNAGRIGARFCSLWHVNTRRRFNRKQLWRRHAWRELGCVGGRDRHWPVLLHILPIDRAQKRATRLIVLLAQI